jgi:serine/threonine protein kinase
VSPGVKLKSFQGTPAYSAPEMTSKKKDIGYAIDVWAAGVVLYVMIYGHLPFKG